VAEADLSAVDSVRAILPSLANRREDVFTFGPGVGLRGTRSCPPPSMPARLT
jgi:hypothetical protein